MVWSDPPPGRGPRGDSASPAVARGRSANRRGRTWMRDCVKWLHDHGAPNADIVARVNANDLTGVGDLGVECTLADWKDIAMKLDQAERDASRRGLKYYCVWKSRRGTTDPGKGFAVTEFYLYWEQQQYIQQLETDLAALRRMMGIQPGTAPAKEKT